MFVRLQLQFLTKGTLEILLISNYLNYTHKGKCFNYKTNLKLLCFVVSLFNVVIQAKTLCWSWNVNLKCQNVKGSYSFHQKFLFNLVPC